MEQVAASDRRIRRMSAHESGELLNLVVRLLRGFFRRLPVSRLQSAEYQHCRKQEKLRPQPVRGPAD